MPTTHHPDAPLAAIRGNQLRRAMRDIEVLAESPYLTDNDRRRLAERLLRK
jgi:hypothetical protein